MKSHVAGLAIGLVWESDDQYALLTDILGKEDHYGDMDFKVAGTTQGVTAVQLDCKFDGLSLPMIVETFERAKQGRLELLNTLNDAISKPNEISHLVEQVVVVPIPQQLIGRVIGTGGVTIKAITKDSGAKIDIKKNGNAYIIGSGEAIAVAREKIQAIIGTEPR